MGVGVGLSACPSTAAMIEFSAADQSRRTSSITTAAQALGLASATLIGGGLIQYAPFPTRLDFWLVFVVLAALFVAAWFLPRHVADATSGRWRLKAVTVPRGIRKIFATSATAVMTGYSLGALMLSLGAQIAHDLIGSDNVLVNGAAIALFAIVWGVVGISAKRLSSRAAMMLGGAASIIGTGLLVLSTAHHALPVFLAAAAAFGVGYSLMFMGGLRLLGDSASADRRGGMLSALLSCCLPDDGRHRAAAWRSRHEMGPRGRARPRFSRHRIAEHRCHRARRLDWQVFPLQRRNPDGAHQPVAKNESMGQRCGGVRFGRATHRRWCHLIGNRPAERAVIACGREQAAEARQRRGTGRPSRNRRRAVTPVSPPLRGSGRPDGFRQGSIDVLSLFCPFAKREWLWP
jgi:MFS family permease